MAIYEYEKPAETPAEPTITLKEIPIYGGSRLGQYRTSYSTIEGVRTADKKTALGQRVYEFSNHLQNVLVVLADFKVPVGADGTTTEFKAIVVSANDYYPFGMVMEGRKYQSETFENKYRYGFNGQEQSDELDEGGNSYTAEYWQYDARLARRWNIDPVAIEWESSYATFRNNPIVLNDPDGDCPSCNYAIRQGLWNYAIGQIIPEIVINENGHVTGTTWQYAGNYQWINVTNNKTGYVYTHADLVQRAKIMALPTSMGLINPIKTELYSREDNGLFHPITTNGYYRQYVARWGTNSAFWFGAENYMTELWDGGGFGSAIGSSARRVRASMRARALSISPNSSQSSLNPQPSNINGKVVDINDFKLRGKRNPKYEVYTLTTKMDNWQSTSANGFLSNHNDPDFNILINIHGSADGNFLLATKYFEPQYSFVTPENLGNYLEKTFKGENLMIAACYSRFNVALLGEFYSGNIKYFNSPFEIGFEKHNGNYYLREMSGGVNRIRAGDVNSIFWKTTK